MTSAVLRTFGQHGGEVPEDTLLHRNVLESMREGVLTVTSDGCIGILNPTASQLLGLHGVEVRGKPIAEVLMDREDLEAFNDVVLAAVYDEADGFRSTVRLKPGDGTERCVAVTTSYLVRREDGENRKIGLVAVLDDVTEVEALREAEREMAEATAAQNVELRDAYREIEDKNRALDSALKKMTAVRALAMVLVVVLFGGAAWYVWDDARAPLAPGSAAPSSRVSPEALTVTVAPRRLVSTVSFVGRLAPRREVPVTSRVSGKVAKVLFEYGDRVVAGQPLVELDTAETDRRYLEARAGYLEARDKLHELENWENGREIARARQSLTLAGMELESRKAKVAETALLLERGVIPASEHRNARQQYEGQRLRYEAAQRDLEAALARRPARTRCGSPGCGWRTRRRACGGWRRPWRTRWSTRRSRGSFFNPAAIPDGGSGGDGAPLAAGRSVGEGGYLLSIADLGGVSVVGGIDEVDVAKVKPGQRVRIGGDAFPDLVFDGRIARVSPQSRAKAGARVPMFDVTAAVDRLSDEHLARLRLGMSANVTVVTRDEPAALLVPVAAVRGGAGHYRVRVKDKDGGAPRDVPVEVGQTTVHEVEILAGLKAGDEVIVSGP